MELPTGIRKGDVLSKRSLLTKGAFCILLLLISVLFFSLEKNERAETIKLRTQQINILPPHGHEIGKDSMGDDGHHVGVQSPVYVAPHDLWITGMHAQIQGAPALTLHHGTIFRMDERDLECPSESPRPIVSIAQDQMHTPELRFESGYGIFIPKGTPLMLDAMFHNPEPPVGPGEVYENVSLEFDLTIAEGDTQMLQPLQYHLLRLSNTPCREYSHTFTVPPQTDSYVFAGTDEPDDASQLTVETQSRIVYFGAHVHGWEGGESLTVFKNKETIEVLQTEHSPDNTYRFNTPHGPRDLTLEPGDVLSIEARYTNPTESPLRGAMGHLGLYLAQ